jgi:hypothetical protein
MKITVDGISYSFIAIGIKMPTTPTDTGVIAAGGDASGRGGGIGFSGIHNPGTYEIGPAKVVYGVPTFAIMTYEYIVPSTHDSVQYAIQGSYTDTTSYGKLKIVELTSTSLKASFYGKLAKTHGISGADTVTVTNGGIYVQLN